MRFPTKHIWSNTVLTKLIHMNCFQGGNSPTARCLPVDTKRLLVPFRCYWHAEPAMLGWRSLTIGMTHVCVFSLKLSCSIQLVAILLPDYFQPNTKPTWNGHLHTYQQIHARANYNKYSLFFAFEYSTDYMYSGMHSQLG